MEKKFTIESTEYTITNVTAIASCDFDTMDRQNALLVVSYKNGEKFDAVVFGYEMPESAEDFEAMCDDPSAWDSDWEVLATVEIC